MDAVRFRGSSKTEEAIKPDPGTTPAVTQNPANPRIPALAAGWSLS